MRKLLATLLALLIALGGCAWAEAAGAEVLETEQALTVEAFVEEELTSEDVPVEAADAEPAPEEADEAELICEGMEEPTEDDVAEANPSTTPGLLTIGDFTYMVHSNAGSARVLSYKGEGGDVVIPGKVARYTVRGIGDEVFQFNSAITSVKIPDSVTSIGDCAFERCSNLRTLDLGSGVETIGELAFAFTPLEEITIPASVTSVGERAFFYCDRAKKLTLREGLTVIGERMFEQCDSLTEVTIPGSVDTIPYCAFYECDQLQEVTVREGVKTIGQSAFIYCNALKTVYLPGSLTDINDWAFQTLIRWLPHGYQYCVIPGLEIRCTGSGGKAPEYAYTHTAAGRGSFDLTKCKVFAPPQTYTGKARKPAPVVLLEIPYNNNVNRVVLRQNTDYAVTGYKNNKKVGAASVTVEGVGLSAGEAKGAFEITPKGTTVKSAKSSKAGQLTITWKKQATQSDGYEIACTPDGDPENPVITLIKGAKTVKKTVKGLHSGEVYYVNIRTWKKVKGVKYYSDWSEGKEYTVK